MAHNLELGKTITLDHGRWTTYDDGSKALYFTLNGAIINGEEYNFTNDHLYQTTRHRDGSSIAPYVENLYSDLTDAAKNVIRDYLLANGPSVQEQVLPEEEIARRVQRRKEYLEETLQWELEKYESDLRADGDVFIYGDPEQLDAVIDTPLDQVEKYEEVQQ